MPNPNPSNNKPRNTTDFPMRIGTDLLRKVTAEAARRDLDRSAFADTVIENALRRGLPTTIDTRLVIDGLRRGDRCLLRLDARTAQKLHAQARKLGIPAATLVTIVFVSALDEAATERAA